MYMYEYNKTKTCKKSLKIPKGKSEPCVLTSLCGIQ